MINDQSSATLSTPLPDKAWSRTTRSLRTKSEKEREEQIQSFLPLVRHLVERCVLFIPPGLTREDLVSAGVYGLVQAIDRYSPREGASLKTYVSIRVRGSILDELRRNHASTRQAQSCAKRLSEVQIELGQSLGREPDEEELREALGMKPAEFEAFLERARPVYFTSLDFAPTEGEGEMSLQDVLCDANATDPADRVVHRDDIQLVRDLLGKLPLQQLQVIKMFYLDNMRGKDIAKTMKLTESRISQLHTLAISRLRSAFFAARS